MNQNEKLFARAQQHIPGGVNSPVRAFTGVGGIPCFITRGKGAYMWDADEKKYIDYIGSWGPLILGHAHPVVVEAVTQAAKKGLSFGAPTPLENDLADLLCSMLPSLEQVRLVSSGTEATMTAIRLARGYTQRSKLIKFEGCYHGHSDALLVKAGSGALTFGHPSSQGVPAGVTEDTLVLPYNDVESLEIAFKNMGDEIAAIIVEPIAGNMNLIKPSPAFIQAMRRLTEQYGAILIYDEVMTGFRVDIKCAQGLHDIRPDLTTLGKIVGGGMPLAAVGGRREIMEKLAPLGGVYQAGTLSGNPLAVAAGLATLELIRVPGFFEQLCARTANLVSGLVNVSRETKIPFSAQSIGGMFGIYFSSECPQSYSEAMNMNKASFNLFFHAMLAQGIYLAPSAFEAGFVSSVHTDIDIATTINAARKAFLTVSTHPRNGL